MRWWSNADRRSGQISREDTVRWRRLGCFLVVEGSGRIPAVVKYSGMVGEFGWAQAWVWTLAGRAPALWLGRRHADDRGKPALECGRTAMPEPPERVRWVRFPTCHPNSPSSLSGQSLESANMPTLTSRDARCRARPLVAIHDHPDTGLTTNCVQRRWPLSLVPEWIPTCRVWEGGERRKGARG